MTQKSTDSKNIDIVYVKGNACRIHFWYMNKHKRNRKREAINLTTNSNLIDEKSILLLIKAKQNGGEKVFYENNYCKICINTEDKLPLKELLKFLIVNIHLILQTDNKLYPQIYLDECFYEL